MTATMPSRSFAVKRYGRFAASALVVAGCLVAIGYFPTRRIAGDSAVGAMIAGCCVSFLASLIGAIPIALAYGNPARNVMTSMSASMLVRLVALAAFGITALLSGWFDRAPLLIWMGISYMGLLVADTRFALRSLPPRDRAVH